MRFHNQKSGESFADDIMQPMQPATCTTVQLNSYGQYLHDSYDGVMRYGTININSMNAVYDVYDNTICITAS